jgi:hypothetical protein
MCGIFTAKERAEAARQQLTLVEGFRDYPDDFLIDELTLDEVLWEDGFVSVRPIEDGADELKATAEREALEHGRLLGNRRAAA